MPETTTIKDTNTTINLGRPCNVILFNDDNHEMGEVISQIMKATGCSTQQATAVMLEAHTSGRAVAYTGHRERCEQVANVLEEIRLGTKIEEC